MRADSYDSERLREGGGQICKLWMIGMMVLMVDGHDRHDGQ